VGSTERLTLAIPYGQRVYVLSDLSLSPTSNESSRPIHELIELLGNIDDPATVVVAGNLLRPDPTSDLVKFVDATMSALPKLCAAISEFTRHEGHQFFVLPGDDDHELRRSAVAEATLATLGIDLANELTLKLATADGVRDLLITAGTSTVDRSRADASDRDDADRLEDPPALERFVSSRVLYRRLSGWVWFPVLAMAVFDLSSTLTTIFNHFTHRHFHVRTLHTGSFWADLVLNLLIIAAAEAVIVVTAGLFVRQRFDRGARGAGTPTLAEPLALTSVDGVDATEFVRLVAEFGGVGAVIGGAPRPALAFLDHAVCASPGPSRTVVVERRGRFGLPPVFTSVERFGVVEIESASTVQVRLLAGQAPRRRETRLERLIAGMALQPAPAAQTTTLGSWPSGKPFPASLERLRDQRHQRRVRRWVSALIFFVGLINVAAAASVPLHGRLHHVLSILPLGVAQSAAAVTAVAGIGMIMMARGLRRGQRRAWFIVVIALGITIFAHLARADAVVSSVLAALLLGLLVMERRHFQGTTDRSSIRSSMPRLGLIVVVTVLAATLGIEFSPARHQLPGVGVVLIACIERLFAQYQIHLPDGVDDFIDPTLATIGISLLVSALYLVTRPVVDRRLSQKGTNTERRLSELRARDIVRRHGRGTLDYFALRDDKQFFFFRDSLVAYAVYGGVALLAPDPIGPQSERTEVFGAFRTFAESRGWTIGIMAAGEEWLPIYHAAGLHYLYLGDEAIVDCPTFSLEGHKMKGLRQACTRLMRHGYTVEYLDPAEVDPAKVNDIVELISMLRRGEDERGFSMMLGRLFDPKDKGLLLTVVHGPDGRPAAVCQFVPSPAIEGYSLDLMRRDPGAHPNGLIDFALCSTISYLADQGVRGLSLNFAAFRSVLDGERGEGTFTKVERWTLKRLSGILPIESLWSFNAKYQPSWLPRHLVYPGPETFVPVVAAILRAESITEIPVLGKFLTGDPSNRPGTVVPPEVLEAARQVNRTPR
jgi:lysyl-tRNA synthetase class 2